MRIRICSGRTIPVIFMRCWPIGEPLFRSIPLRESFWILTTIPGIIALASLKDGTGTDGYVEFDIKFDYRSLERRYLPIF